MEIPKLKKIDDTAEYNLLQSECLSDSSTHLVYESLYSHKKEYVLVRTLEIGLFNGKETHIFELILN